MKKALILFLFVQFGSLLLSQTDTSQKKSKKLNFLIGKDTNFVFQNIRIIDRIDTSERPYLAIGGYISTYYGYYDDDTQNGEFVQFPTVCARNNQFSLNMAMISMEYRSQHLRSNLIFHYGDIPQSSWPKEFNLIQEANFGFRLYKKLWFDAGFFKTHIGVESFQPRENICTSLAIPTFYEPYYLSGAKLTFEASQKFIIQLNAFNGYNEYIDNNRDKAVGLSMVYTPNSNIVFTYNFLTSDETPDNIPTKHRRFYNNFYTTLNLNKLSIGAELNFGAQNNTNKADTTQMAYMTSGLITCKYAVGKRIFPYGRLEYFSDPDRMLATDVNIGKYIYGSTVGVEYVPYKNIAFSLEGRGLQSDKLIFRNGKYITNQRIEIIACVDLWF